MPANNSPVIPVNNSPATKLNSVEERALHLLGQGIPAVTVAAACGVSESRISQLLSDENFIAKVSELRFNNLEKHNVTDNAYDDLETTLLERLKDCIPLMGMDPMKLLKAIQVINGAKRRGVSAPEHVTAQQTVVQLVMPNVIMQKFTTNINNQVIQAGDQTLQTIQSSALTSLAAPSFPAALAAPPSVSYQAPSAVNNKDLEYVKSTTLIPT